MWSILGFVAGGLLQAFGAQALSVKISVSPGLFNGVIDGRAVVMLSPPDSDPLDDYDDVTSKNYIFGKDLDAFAPTDAIDLLGGTDGYSAGVAGWPLMTLNDVPAGKYRIQAFMTRYTTVKRSDGSKVQVRFPCGDGAPQIDAPGSLESDILNVDTTSQDSIQLTFNKVAPREAFAGKEIGGCAQGNYADTRLLKYVKIRSQKLSDYWARDMYVGATVLLPNSYSTSEQRYPVVYSQGHWPGDRGAFNYPASSYAKDWDRGVNPETNSTAPQLILITFRHEAPFYDDSYAVNSANLGPWGDAINDELIPYIDKTFRTIPQPYARIQEGGSTGGWISAASVIYRPDLFGYCFSSYPDSLDFHRHQDIYLYDEPSAYTHLDGSPVPSIRRQRDGVDTVLVTTESENHWELSFGTKSRSNLQWDIWNAVFGAQGYNNYPLEPWNKMTGEIYPDAVAYWKDMDLANYIVSNWDNERNLGQVLKGRIFIYVGSADTYYLNEGVEAFGRTIATKTTDKWANITIFPGKAHGGNYQLRTTWNYLAFLEKWVQDHGPNGTTPLDSKQLTTQARGNEWEDILQNKGRQTALARQADPEILNDRQASVGRWDPGVVLTAQWRNAALLNTSEPFTVKQGALVDIPSQNGTNVKRWRLYVTGSKAGYKTETRKSSPIPA